MNAATAVRGAFPGSALTAWGAGLIQLAIGAGTLTGTQQSAVLTPAAGTVLIGLGAAGFAWGGTALARGRLVVPRAGVAGILAGIITLGVALSLDPTRISVIAVAVASALLLVSGVGCALALRFAGRQMDASSPRVAWIVVSAVLVSAVVTPALAATEAGRLAPDHSVHGVVVSDHH